MSPYPIADAHDGHFSAAFAHSVAMVVATEIGDKTFFIAAVLAMSRDVIIVFLGAWGALATMTVLSAFLGLVLPSLLAKEYVHWFVVMLFLWFGLKALYDGLHEYAKGEGVGFDELEEVEEELKAFNKAVSPTDGTDDAGGKVAYDPKAKSSKSKSGKESRTPLFSAKSLKMIYAIYAMVLMAEWGDKSQVATIAMGAARDSLGVILGGLSGHFLCTGVACAGGKLMAEYLSERLVLTGSGILFIIFAIQAVIAGPED